MNARPLFAEALAFLALTAVTASPAAASALDLVPSVTPAVLVLKDPSALFAKARTFAPAPAAEKPPSAAGGGESLSIPGFGALPPGVDAHGEFVLAMPQFPFPLVIMPVSDYGRFLDGLRQGAGEGGQAPPPVPSPPGIDSVTWNGKPFFARYEGGRVFLSTLPMLLTAPAPGSALGTSLGERERELLSRSDVFLRLDMAFILATLDPFIQQGLQRIENAGEPPLPGSGPSTPRAPAAPGPGAAKAQAELLLQGLRQVRSLVVGGSIDEESATLTSLLAPQAGSGFERIIGALQPGDFDLLRCFDDDAAMAGAFNLDPVALKDVVLAFSELSVTAGGEAASEEDKNAWRSFILSGLEVAGKRSAWYVGPSRSGGALSSVIVSEVKDAGKARSLIRDSLGLTERVLSSAGPGAAAAMRMEMKEGVERHGEVPIDRITFRLSTGDPEEDRKLESGMGLLFGGSGIDAWVAFKGDFMVASYYSSTTDELRGVLDRIEGPSRGTLVPSPAFREATSGLPARGTSLSFFSIPRFASLVMAAAGRVATGAGAPPPPPPPLDPSGIGFSSRAEGGLLELVNRIPKREAANIRAVAEYVKGLKGKGGPAGGDGPGAEPPR